MQRDTGKPAAQQHVAGAGAGSCARAVRGPGRAGAGREGTCFLERRAAQAAGRAIAAVRQLRASVGQQRLYLALHRRCGRPPGRGGARAPAPRSALLALRASWPGRLRRPARRAARSTAALRAPAAYLRLPTEALLRLALLNIRVATASSMRITLGGRPHSRPKNTMRKHQRRISGACLPDEAACQMLRAERRPAAQAVPLYLIVRSGALNHWAAAAPLTQP